jgi:hypothetical protein
MKPTAFLFLLLALSASAAPSEAYFKALHMVETGGKLGPTLGDFVDGRARALGPLQIHRLYFVDSGIKDGRYEDCARLDFAERVVSAYAKKYESKAWRDNDVVVLARLHNGGPRWAKKPSTISYSQRLLKFYKPSK